MAKEKKFRPRRHIHLIHFVVFIVIRFFGKTILKKANAEVERYTPKHKTFILIGNHSDVLDPAYQMIALRKYVKFVAADFLAREGFWFHFILETLNTVIIKERNKPSSILIENIMKTLEAGIPVGLHAEGIITSNGETGFISENTGKLVKDSGVALITFRTVGGYFRRPRWTSHIRKGPVSGKVIREYSPEELAEYSVEEINEIIRRDIYVNAFEEQRKNKKLFRGEKLAEYAERAVYMCPKCGKVGGMHSHDDVLECDCGYYLTFGEDGFFHSDRNEVIYDNILDWDKWQRNEWKNRLLSSDDDILFTEDRQKVYTIVNNEKNLLCDDGILRICKDRYEIDMKGEIISLPFDKLKRVQNASYQEFILVTEDMYYMLDRQVPRSSFKLTEAWYILQGREYI
ncbi:MAG: 1-acyl-sn-glycerol-3-phosphate acyltransferase [Clostridiales bacterium]|nr:1-acyl-sn-glycerol-3-phosphate acyltransferase [Clostridiales bacterium]